MNIKFEFSNFEIEYMQNSVKTKKLISFGPKCPNLNNCAQNLNNESKQEISDFPKFEIQGRFGLFRNFSGLFWLILSHFRCFDSFWLVLVRFDLFRVLVIAVLKDHKSEEATTITRESYEHVLCQAVLEQCYEIENVAATKGTDFSSKPVQLAITKFIDS